MAWLIIIGVAVLLSFAIVLVAGAPYLPTLSPQVETALQLANLKPGQTLLELGCGDGRVLIAAAQTGVHAVGYELNPLLVLVAKWRTRRFRKHVRVEWGDMWGKPWPPVDGIFTFLLPRYMQKLDTKITQYKHKPVKLVSFAFEIPDREPAEAKDGVYLYTYND